MRITFLSITVAAGVAIALTAASHAGVIYNSAQRSVVASYQFPDFGDQYTQSSSGFDHWWGGDGPLISPEGNAIAIASQASTIHPLYMQGSFLAHGFFSQPVDSVPFAFAAAESRMTVHFTVTEATPFALWLGWSTIGTGVWPAIADMPSVSFLKTDDMSEIVHVEMEVSTTGETLSDSLAISGTLEPGDYLFDAAILAHAVSGTDYGSAYSNFSANMQFQMTFIPAPGALALFAIACVGASRRRHG